MYRRAAGRLFCLAKKAQQGNGAAIDSRAVPSITGFSTSTWDRLLSTVSSQPASSEGDGHAPEVEAEIGHAGKPQPAGSQPRGGFRHGGRGGPGRPGWQPREAQSSDGTSAHPSPGVGSSRGRGYGNGGSANLGGSLLSRLESLTNAGDAVGVRKTFDAALAAAQKEAAASPGTPLPSELATPQPWRLYFLALEQTNAHPMFVASRVRTMHDLGVPTQEQGYVVLIKRCSEGHMGNMAYSKVVEMKEKGLAPTMACYLYAITACLKSQQPGYAKRLFEMVRDANPEQNSRQLTMFGKLSIMGIREFARWGRFMYCYELMDDMDARGLTVPAFLLTDILHLAAVAGRNGALLDGVRRLAGVKQYFQVAPDDPQGKIVRPIKVDEGSLQEILAVAAQKGDAELAAETWALLLRSLALPNSPLYSPKPGVEQPEEEAEGYEGLKSCDEAFEPLVAEAGAAEHSVESSSTAGEQATAAPAALFNARVRYEESAAAHVPRLPQVVSYHALIHAYGTARKFRNMFQAVGELQAAYPEVHSAAAYYGGLQPAVDALAHSTALIDDAYYVLEDMARSGETLTPAMLNTVVAACSQVGDIKRGLETFDAYETLGVTPDADTYNALMQGCIECGMLDTMEKVLKEMHRQGVAPNAHTHHLLVERCIVASDVQGMMRTLCELESAGHTPKTRLLERCVARCERAGDREGIKALLERLFANDYRIVGIDAQFRRWQSEGGMALLTGSSKWVNREQVVKEVEASRGKHFIPGRHTARQRSSGSLHHGGEQQGRQQQQQQQKQKQKQKQAQQQ